MMKIPRIVVVDDDENVRSMMGTVLSEHGYKVDTIGSGDKLAVYLEKSFPDLVWLDLLMPDTDSFVILTLIKKRSPGTKVVCMSAYTTDAVVDSSLALMADMVVSKPFCDIEDVVLITDEVLKEK